MDQGGSVVEIGIVVVVVVVVAQGEFSFRRNCKVLPPRKESDETLCKTEN